MKPVKVSKVDLAFGGDISKLLPPMEDIPKEFVSRNNQNKWVKMVNDWFFHGLSNVNWVPKEGIDAKEAVEHISAVMRSFQPSHEHKEAGCAYLLSEFFEDVTYELAK